MALPKQFAFDQVLADAVKTGNAQFDTKKSNDWFQRNITKYNITRASVLTKSSIAGRDKLNIQPGKMFFYGYDPKGKNELPFYDAFPLIFIIDKTPKGWTGLNLHYCPVPLRYELMKQLFQFSTDKRYTPRTKLQLSYSTLKTASGLPFYKPCFKQYLVSQLRTKFIEILPAEWTAALYLPVADWRKASETAVWQWSKEQMK